MRGLTHPPQDSDDDLETAKTPPAPPDAHGLAAPIARSNRSTDPSNTGRAGVAAPLPNGSRGAGARTGGGLGLVSSVLGSKLRSTQADIQRDSTGRRR